MTYKRHWLLSWGGTLGYNRDIWANNVRFMNDQNALPDSVSGGILEQLLDDYVGDIRAFMTSPGSMICQGVSCTWVKFNEIGPDGRYQNPTTTHARYLSGTTGANAVINGVKTATVPTYQSVAITLTTDAQRGPGSKGRIFLPHCAPSLTSQGDIDSTSQQSMVTAAAAFFTDLGNEGGLDNTNMRPAVVSNVGDPGPQRPVTGVKIGSVPDIISRRKNAIPEVYVTAPVT